MPSKNFNVWSSACISVLRIMCLGIVKTKLLIGNYALVHTAGPYAQSHEIPAPQG